MKPIIAALFFLTTTVQNFAVAEELDYLQGLNSPIYHKLQSETLDRPFHIYLRLPEGYEDSEANYPTVYLLDGGITFPLLGAYYRYLSLSGEVPDMIIVGISYGNTDFGGGNFRGSDFTAAAPDREHYGGAPEYQKFLEQELLPFVEENFRSDETRRIIFGQSLGGQFVLYTALTEPDLFWGHIASNPALHRNLPYFLARPGDDRQTSSKLFVTSGADDNERFRTPALAWIEHWTAQEDTPWTLRAKTLPDETHFSPAPTVFRQGIAWLFEDE